MIIRLWKTGLVSDRAVDYDAFASGKSLAMFKQLDGCLGVLFLRSDDEGYVFSFWRDQQAIDDLQDSRLYQDTVKEISDAGFLELPQSVALVKLTGGFLTDAALNPIVALGTKLSGASLR